MKALLIWWARWRLNSNRCDLNKALRAPAAGPVFVSRQIQNITDLECQIAALGN